jgi:hypothetical protein
MLNRKISLYLLLSIAAMCCLLACKKDKNNGDGNAAIVPVPTLTAIINSNPFTASTIVHSMEDTMHVYVCTATNGDKLTIKISNLAMGQQLITPDDPTITFLTGGILYDQNPAPSGQITISEKTTYRISGSFETAVNNISETGQTYQITSGSFSQLEY